MRHGLTKHPIYRVWLNMKSRCLNSNHRDYKYYGGRGIHICARWLVFVNFRDDMLSTWESGLWIEHQNNDNGYNPENCCWATRSEQMKNRRAIPKEKHPMYGKHHSVESRKRMSKAHQGMKLSPEHKAKIAESVKSWWAERKNIQEF